MVARPGWLATLQSHARCVACRHETLGSEPSRCRAVIDLALASPVPAAVLSTTLPGLALGETITVPALVGGQVASRQAEKTLTVANTVRIRAWLERHGSGWQPNLATPPVPELTVSLRAGVQAANAQAPAIVLSLWPNAQATDWRRAILVEEPGTLSPRIQTFPAKEVAVLLGFVR